MASKRFNIIFNDGNEYETTLYESGGIKIKSEYGGVILELGHYQMMNVVEILDRIRGELKWADRYNNPIETIEEVERMELDDQVVMNTMSSAIETFIAKSMRELDNEEQMTVRSILGAYSIHLFSCLCDVEESKLDKMAEAER